MSKFNLNTQEVVEGKGIHTGFDLTDDQVNRLQGIFEEVTADETSITEILAKCTAKCESLEEVVFQAFVVGTIVEGQRSNPMAQLMAQMGEGE